MERPSRFEHSRFIGDKRTQLVYDLDTWTDEDVVNDEPRTVLRLHPRIAPYQVAVLPLSKKDTLTPLAEKVFASLTNAFGLWCISIC